MTPFDLSLGSVADIVVALVAIVGIPLVIWELRNTARTSRASFLLDATERYFSDDEVRKLYYDIDYGRFEIEFDGGHPRSVRRGDRPEVPFVGSDEERYLDHLLYTLETIGTIVQMRVLEPKEARIFAFQAQRVLSNESVAAYVKWVTDQRGGTGEAWGAARLLAALPSS